MAKRNLKIKYYGLLGLLGLLGFLQPAYFLFFLFFLFFIATPAGGSPTAPDLIEKQAKEKEEHKKKILEILDTKAQITNNNVEKLLGISDSTATRYLAELEEAGAIKQVGTEGRSVYYQKA